MHVNHRAGFPLFAGESLLHIACVNQQEELLCLMLQLAEQRLPSAGYSQHVAVLRGDWLPEGGKVHRRLHHP